MAKNFSEMSPAEHAAESDSIIATAAESIMAHSEDTPTVKLWRFEHPDLDGPLEIEGIWSGNVMRMWAIRWLDTNLPEMDWMLERDQFTVTCLGVVEAPAT